MHVREEMPARSAAFLERPPPYAATLPDGHHNRMSAALSCALESAVGAGDADLSGRGLELLMRYREEREQQLMAKWRLVGRG